MRLLSAHTDLALIGLIVVVLGLIGGIIVKNILRRNQALGKVFTGLFTVCDDSGDPENVKTRVMKKFPRAAFFVQYIEAQWLFDHLRYLPIGLLKMGECIVSGQFDGEKRTARLIYGGIPYSMTEMAMTPVTVEDQMAKTTDYWIGQAGISLVGLGGFTACHGHAEFMADTFSEELAVDSGNDITGYIGALSIVTLAREMGHTTQEMCLAIIGGGGSVGHILAQVAAQDFARVLLVGNPRSTQEKKACLHNLAYMINAELDRDVVFVCESAEMAIRQSLAIVTVSSKEGPLDIEPSWFQVGAICLDAARPRDVARMVMDRRKGEVLFIDGGLVKLPEGMLVKQSMSFGGCDPDEVYACMASAIIHLLRNDPPGEYAIGTNYPIRGTIERAKWAFDHGFTIAGYRSFERKLTQEEIDAFREVVRKANNARAIAAAMLMRPSLSPSWR